uniref:Uncharacterized protein n=1 Tax=Oryza barthii TaxID=65489 RepID=A0A0D3F8R3_9ORYZ
MGLTAYQTLPLGTRACFHTSERVHTHPHRRTLNRATYLTESWATRDHHHRHGPRCVSRRTHRGHAPGGIEGSTVAPRRRCRTSSRPAVDQWLPPSPGSSRGATQRRSRARYPGRRLRQVRYIEMFLTPEDAFELATKELQHTAVSSQIHL